HAELVEAPAIELSQHELKEYFEKGYGIFSGTKVAWAKLRFTPERARWVSTEQWHPEQKCRFDKEGYYCL
ncbi:MAG: transcriptional regulator, partial [Candidatus Nitrotoga sp.]|nr:transcriptional regulator [Candidatus Nitrotoga sp.]